MNRIESEQIMFYFQHEARIREWVDLQTDAIEFVDGYYRSLKGDLDAAIGSGEMAADGVESFLDEDPLWGGLGLRRQDWPEGYGEPRIKLQWNRKLASFPPHEELICGVCTNVKEYRQSFTKETCPDYPLKAVWWPAHKEVEPPDDRFWEGDNLKKYRRHLVKTILKAWEDLAPLVDEAVGLRSSGGTVNP